MEEAVERYLEKYESDEDESSSSEESEPERKWDCESILSTYSNIYNHPQLISEPRSSKIKGRFTLLRYTIIKRVSLIASIFLVSLS